MEKTIKILCAEDSKLWRALIIKELASYNIESIGEAENGNELLKLLETKTPDVILLDLKMPDMNGAQAMEKIRETYPLYKVIILSYYSEEELIDDFILRGAKGYLAKDTLTIEMLVSAIKKVCSNETFVFKKPGNRKKYTQRQVEMIPRICNGLTNKEIAKQIGLTEWGVEKQRKKIYSIAGTKNGVEFFKYAFQEGLNYLGGMVKKYK